MDEKPEDMLSTGKACRILGIHANTLRRYNEQGIIKSYRSGPRGDRRFMRGDVYALLKDDHNKTGIYPPELLSNDSS
ncbi:MAG: helix-turn-helix domain-containing protein [Candidatus Aenigmarchaeota archaeon]|nr:helix-turn-helix domain-containing protein [Candidatus Aenigmarchaeota archaeon]